MNAVVSLGMYKFFNTFARFMSFLEKKKNLGYRKKTRKLHRSTLLRVVVLSRFLKIHSFKTLLEDKKQLQTL